MSTANAEIFELPDDRCNHHWIANHSIIWFPLAVLVIISDIGYHYS